MKKDYEHEALKYAEKFGIIDYQVQGNEMTWIDKNLDFNQECNGWVRSLNLDTNKIITTKI